MENDLFEESLIVRVIPISAGLFHVFYASKRAVELWGGIEKVPSCVCGGEIKVLDTNEEKIKNFLEEATLIGIKKGVYLFEYWSN